MADSTKKTALVTGCTEGGIGYYLAQTLAEEGWNVVGSVRKHGKEGDLGAKGVKIIEMSVDSLESIEKGKAAFLEISPRLDLLINNAGMGSKEVLIEVPPEEVQTMFQTNVFGQLWCCQAFGKIMTKAGSGIIVNVASVAGIAPVAWMGLYGATKAALRSLSTTLDYELRPLGVKVVSLSPALVHTPFSTKHTKLDYQGTVYTKQSVTESEKAVDVFVDTGNGRGMDPKKFSKEVIRQLSWSEPPHEIVVGTDSWIFTTVAPYMPTWIWRKMNAKNCNTAVLRSAQ